MEITDDFIVSAFAQNLERGFRLFMSKYKEPVYWYVRRLVVTHEDAQDVAQNTFVKVFRSSANLQEVHSLKSWVYRIATNESVTFLRTKRDTASLADLGAEPATADSYVDYSDVESVRLQQAIGKLPEKQRLAFHLRYYEEMNYQEMAEVMGSSPATAKVNYHLAKEKIVKQMNA